MTSLIRKKVVNDRVKIPREGWEELHPLGTFLDSGSSPE
jgi:hypothetical protein